MDLQLLTFEKSPQLNWVLWRGFLPVILCSATVLQSEALLWYWLESCTSFCVKCSGEAFLLRVLNRSACSTMALWWIHAQNFKGNSPLSHGRSISPGLFMCEFPYFSQTSDFHHWRHWKGWNQRFALMCCLWSVFSLPPPSSVKLYFNYRVCIWYVTCGLVSSL